MAKNKGLTAKEMRFCKAYITNGYNATRAYQEAYNCEYSTANAQGYRVLRKENVKKYIQELQKQAFSEACITAERVAIKLAEIAFAEKGDVDYNATAQLKALDLIQKQLGLQTQRVEADISTDINITIEE